MGTRMPRLILVRDLFVIAIQIPSLNMTIEYFSLNGKYIMDQNQKWNFRSHANLLQPFSYSLVNCPPHALTFL